MEKLGDSQRKRQISTFVGASDNKKRKMDDFQLVWMNPVEPDHHVSWDASMCVSNATGAEARRLMLKALKGPLILQQQQQLLSELEKEARLVHNIGLTPAKVCADFRCSVFEVRLFCGQKRKPKKKKKFAL